VIHGNYVGFVLAWAWHIEILCSRVKFHAKGKLRLLLADSVDIVWISRVGEVEVTWNVVLWTWYSHELHLLRLFLLNLSDFLGEISIVFTNATSRAFTSLGSCTERSRFSSVSHMDRLMGARTKFFLPLITLSLTDLLRLSKAPRWCLRRVLRTVGAGSWYSIRLSSFPFRAACERLRRSRLGELRVVRARTWRILAQISWLLNISHGIGERKALSLMRFQELPLITEDVVVMRRSRLVELLLPLVR